jgi:hypothetical protein
LINKDLLAEAAGVGLKSRSENNQVLDFKARWKRRKAAGDYADE